MWYDMSFDVGIMFKLDFLCGFIGVGNYSSHVNCTIREGGVNNMLIIKKYFSYCNFSKNTLVTKA